MIIMPRKVRLHDFIYIYKRLNQRRGLMEHKAMMLSTRTGVFFFE
jgi:hypothetical protein